MTRIEAQKHFTDRTVVAVAEGGDPYIILCLYDSLYATWNWDGVSDNSAWNGQYFEDFYEAILSYTQRAGLNWHINLHATDWKAVLC